MTGKPPAPVGLALVALNLAQELEDAGLPIHAEPHPSDCCQILLAVNGAEPDMQFGWVIEPWLEGACWTLDHAKEGK